MVALFNRGGVVYVLMERSENIANAYDIEILVDDSFVDVSQFNESTKIPIPEMTHAQELLHEPIPLRNRIAHLIPYVEPTVNTLTADEIAQKIGAESKWVKRIGEKIGITTTDRVVGESTFSVYPSLSLELLEEERQWYISYRVLDEKLTDYQIGEYLAKDPKWVMMMSEQLEVYPDLIEDKPGHFKRLYPKDVIQKLRHLILLYAPAQDYRNVYELAQQFGQRWEWVKARLDKSDIASEKRWSFTNLLLDHYPPESEHIISQAVIEKAPPAGGWLTKKAIALQVGKDFSWVEKNINKELGVMLRDDSGRNQMHFSPSELERLQALVDELHSYPVVVDQLAVKSIAKLLHRREPWVKSRLPLVPYAPLTLRNAQDKLNTYYENGILAALSELPENSIGSEPYTEDTIIDAIHSKIAPDEKITTTLIKKLKKDDASMPSLTTVQSRFESMAELNRRRKERVDRAHGL